MSALSELQPPVNRVIQSSSFITFSINKRDPSHVPFNRSERMVEDVVIEHIHRSLRWLAERNKGNGVTVPRRCPRPTFSFKGGPTNMAAQLRVKSRFRTRDEVRLSVVGSTSGCYYSRVLIQHSRMERRRRFMVSNNIYVPLDDPKLFSKIGLIIDGCLGTHVRNTLDERLGAKRW